MPYLVQVFVLIAWILLYLKVLVEGEKDREGNLGF